MFQVSRNRKLHPSKESMEGTIKILSLHWLEKYCSRGYWVFLSAKFLPPGFQLWSWPQVIKFTHIQHEACLVFSLPFPLLLCSLHFLFCSLWKRIIIQFFSECLTKEKYTKSTISIPLIIFPMLYLSPSGSINEYVEAWPLYSF